MFSAVRTTRSHRLLALHGEGFRRTGEDAEEITRKYDTEPAYVCVGRPETGVGFEIHPDPDPVRPFTFDAHLDWLTPELARLNLFITQP